MTSHEHGRLLPRVEEDDLLNCVFEDVTGPTHRGRWQTFASSNPTLAREVLKRVCVITGANLEAQKILIDEITYVYGALATAAFRLVREEEHTLVIVGDGDEGQQPSI